jgi:carbon starvation protein CstA
MITFLVSIVLLILGYIVYGRFVAKVFGVDANRPTPAIVNPDGVDYVAMPWWKIFLIQFLNIAGLGPIFGAIMGVMFGPSAFLWIVFGSIFGGAVHDYLSGMLSLRRNGASLPELVGEQLGTSVKQFMRAFSLILMVLVGAVFVSGPAGLLAGMVDSISVTWWIVIIFLYYLLATLLPIDKLIGKVYPIFGLALLFMAVGILVSLFINKAPIPEITSGLASQHPQGYSIFPMMFVSIACGAVSGFHATQSPMMARCMTNERYGRPCFYGAMIAEGVVALIWAAAASSFFGSVGGLQEYVASLPATANKAAEVVNLISNSWLGSVGGILAVLGVVAAPITSGDTALRSARLIAADFLHIDQKPIFKRFMIALPLFVATFILLQINFDIIWRYFAWCNQTLSVFTFWALTVYLYKEKRNYWITLLPALFMTAVCSAYIMVAPEGFGLPLYIGYITAAIVCISFLLLFICFTRNRK